MIKPITQERWDEAQIAERKQHKLSLEEGINHYRVSYSHNFRYLGIDPSTKQKLIMEIGCADFPALRYCPDKEMCLIVEPLPSDYLKRFCDDEEVGLCPVKFEDPFIVITSMMEIWMFNVLQHVQDPEKFISKAKRARIVRYFEPINTGITPYHPHSFLKDDFERWFPEVNKYYNETTNSCFHDGPCCYGVYKNPLC